MAETKSQGHQSLDNQDTFFLHQPLAELRHGVFCEAKKAEGGGREWSQEYPHISVPFPSNSGVLKPEF